MWLYHKILDSFLITSIFDYVIWNYIISIKCIKIWNIDYIKLSHFNHSVTVELDYIKFGFLPIKIIDFDQILFILEIKQ